MLILLKSKLYFRYIGFGCYVNQGEPPSIMSFGIISSFINRIVYGKYGRKDLEISKMKEYNDAKAEMRGKIKKKKIIHIFIHTYS